MRNMKVQSLLWAVHVSSPIMNSFIALKHVSFGSVFKEANKIHWVLMQRDMLLDIF